MIGSLTSNNTRMLESSMDYLWKKQAAIADNVANAETPNYKAKYVQFEDSFQARLVHAATNNANSAEMRSVIDNSQSVTYVATDELFKSDGNGVDVAAEELEALRTNYQMQYVLNSISSNFSLLKSAISG